MRKSLAVVLTMMSVVGLAAEDIDSKIAATRDDQIRDKFSQGVELSRIGRLDEAAIVFRDALALNPSDKLVFNFIRALGEAQILHWVEREELAPVMRDVLRRAGSIKKDLRRDPEYISLLIGKLMEGEMVRLAATQELKQSARWRCLTCGALGRHP